MGEAGRVGGRRVEVVQVRVEIGCDVIGRDGDGGGVLGITDQRRVPVNGEGLVLVDDQRALGGGRRAAAGVAVGAVDST